MLFNIEKDVVLNKVLFLFLSLISFSGVAQNISRISCLDPYEVGISKERSGVIEKEIQYEFHDDHPFWYRINFEDNMKVKYDIVSLDQNSNFDIYLYQYDGNQFCKMFINSNLESISFKKSLEYKSSKGSSYYLGIYPLFSGGCGHKITLEAEKSMVQLTVINSKVKCGLGEEVVSNKDDVTDKAKINIRGHVSDALTGNKINATITLIDPFTGHEERVFSNDKDGYKVGLMEDGDYKVKISSFGYKEKLTGVAAYDGDYLTFSLLASEEMNYVLNHVYFYPNTYALKDESMEELESVFSFISNHPELQMKIIGHTNGNKDVKASRFVKESGEEWNFTGSAEELSLKRAEKIKEYLVEKGIDEYLLSIEGKGGLEMIVQDPSTLKEAMKNIRVEIKISRQD